MSNCGISGFVLCRYSAASSLQSFSRRFVHLAEGGGFLCVSKRESAPQDKLVCSKEGTGAAQANSCEESEESADGQGMLSPLWNKPFLQIQISLEDVDSISEYTGVTPGVAPEYAFGLQGEGRVITTSSISGSSRLNRINSSSSIYSNSVCGSVSERGSQRRHPESQVWALLFPSAQERDAWKEVLLRVVQRAEGDDEDSVTTGNKVLEFTRWVNTQHTNLNWIDYTSQKHLAMVPEIFVPCLPAFCLSLFAKCCCTLLQLFSSHPFVCCYAMIILTYNHVLSSADDRALADLAAKMFSTVTITDRFIQAVKYSNCFTGYVCECCVMFVA